MMVIGIRGAEEVVQRRFVAIKVFCNRILLHINQAFALAEKHRFLLK